MVRYKTKRGLEKVRIYINSKDIADGVCNNPFNCAVTQALKRNFGTDKVGVGQTSCSINRDDYDIDPNGMRFIYEFDNNPTIPPNPNHITITLRRRRR